MILPKICDDGSRSWYKDGMRHRHNGLPAIEWVNGTKFWFKDGKLHRDNDLPAIERASGYKEWWKDGKHLR